MTARTAARLASSPAAKIIARVPASGAQGIVAPRPNRCGATATSAARPPQPSPSPSKSRFSRTTSSARVFARKPAARSRASSPRRSSTLRNCTAARPRSPAAGPARPGFERSTSTCSVRPGSRPAAGPWSGSPIRNRPASAPGPLGLAWSGAKMRPVAAGILDEEEAIATHLGVEGQQGPFLDQQIALENAVCQQGGHSQAERPAAPVGDFIVLAKSLPEPQARNWRCSAPGSRARGQGETRVRRPGVAQSLAVSQSRHGLAQPLGTLAQAKPSCRTSGGVTPSSRGCRGR